MAPDAAGTQTPICINTSPLKNAKGVVICASAVRSGYVVEALSFKGYTNVKHLAAGFIAGWEKAGYPVVK